MIPEFDTFGFEPPGIGHNLTLMFYEGVSIFVLLFIIDYRIPQRIFYFIIKVAKMCRKCLEKSRKKTQKIKPLIEIENEIEPDRNDDDVVKERNRIKQMKLHEIKTYELVIKKLTKFYGKFLAVNKMSVAIEGYVKKIKC